MEEEDRKTVWLEDAERAEQGGFHETARACYVVLLENFPTSASVWRRAAEFEKAHGSSQAMLDILMKGVEHCPHAEVLWLMAAKEKWVGGDVPGAQAILAEAFKQNEDSESIFLAAAKLAAETGEMDAAQQIMEKARVQADTERIWMKSAVLARQLGKLDEALAVLEEAIKKYPTFDKLHMIRGQIYDARGDISAARNAFAQGCKHCAKSLPLWILSARLEEKAGVTIKARSLLEKGRMYNPKNEDLWAESIKIEERAGGTAQAKSLLARGEPAALDCRRRAKLTHMVAMQECPASPLLWSMAIFMEAPQQRKGRSVDALRKAGEHPAVILAVARLFWAERKIEKTRQWMGNAITADKDYGDAWGWWYKFEQQHGEPERLEKVVKDCEEAAPRHGPVWQSVSKDLQNVGKTTKEILEQVAKKLE